LHCEKLINIDRSHDSYRLLGRDFFTEFKKYIKNKNNYTLFETEGIHFPWVDPRDEERYGYVLKNRQVGEKWVSDDYSYLCKGLSVKKSLPSRR
jgi:hypothetical protein